MPFLIAAIVIGLIAFGVLFFLNAPIVLSVIVGVIAAVASGIFLPMWVGAMDANRSAAQTEIVVTPTPVVVVATAQPESQAQPQSSEEVKVPAGICSNKPHNEGGNSIPLNVPTGHLYSVQWYQSGWSTHTQSVLPPGNYTPKEGVMIGAWYDYKDCDQGKVETEAMASAGSLTAWSDGFSQS